MPEVQPSRGQRQMPASRSAWRRLGWFVLLWLGGVVVTGAVALVLRFWIG